MDRSGTKIIAASDDCTVKVIDLQENVLTHSLGGHEGAVQVSLSTGPDLGH